MIRMLVKLGQYLDKRFPEKLVVSAEEYARLKQDMDIVKQSMNQIDSLIQRLNTVEQNAVHKQPVQELITVVKDIKDEFASLKTSLGMTGVVKSDLQAVLNGEYIQGE